MAETFHFATNKPRTLRTKVRAQDTRQGYRVYRGYYKSTDEEWDTGFGQRACRLLNVCMDLRPQLTRFPPI